MDNRKRKSVVASGSASSNAPTSDEIKRRRVPSGARKVRSESKEEQAELRDPAGDSPGDNMIAAEHSDEKQPDESIPLPTTFIKRAPDTFVPLIPMDELPAWLIVRGLRPFYTMNEVEELRGHIVFSQGPINSWTAEIDQSMTQDMPGSSTRDQANLGEQIVPSTRVINNRLNAASASRSQTSVMPPPANTLSARRGPPTAASTTTQRYNPTTPGVLGQKVYCTHWMRTGECDFTQQGCMFLHCMPDLDTLEKLGFRAYPRWFREMPRQYQEQNSKEFSADGLNPQRVQIREMQQMTSKIPPPPPPPPGLPPSRRENVYGNGRNGPMDWHKEDSPDLVPLYNGLGQPKRRSPDLDTQAEHERNGYDPTTTEGRSILSRDGSPSSTSRKLRAYEALTPSVRGSETSVRMVSKKIGSNFKPPSRSAIDAKAKAERAKPHHKFRPASEIGEASVDTCSIDKDVVMKTDVLGEEKDSNF